MARKKMFTTNKIIRVDDTFSIKLNYIRNAPDGIYRYASDSEIIRDLVDNYYQELSEICDRNM